MLRDPDSWLARLPLGLLDQVVWPQRVESFHDDSVPASKWRGYDTDGDLCYYRHWFSLWEDQADDEEPYRRLLLSESLEAWRSRDGLWVRHLQRAEGADACRGRNLDTGFEFVPPHAIPRL
jgi:hypothetical protein